MNNTYWVPEIPSLYSPPPSNMLDWLTKPTILSQALKRLCNELTVRVLEQSFHSPHADEFAILNMSMQEVPFVRRVFLEGDKIPWTYGRVVIPLRTYEKHFAQFLKLGNNLLGETLLYKNPDVTRSGFEYVSLDKLHPLFKEVSDLTEVSSPLWGRRSVFSIKDAPLLVTELFLPSIPHYL